MARDIGTLTSPEAGGRAPDGKLRSGGAGPVTRRSLLLAGAGAMAGGTVPSRVALGQTRPQSPIVLGQVSLSFYAVTGAVVQDVLERLGHEVEVRQGPHEQMFPLLGDGQIDLLAAAWLPEGHASYWSRYAAQAAEVARLYDGARLFWAVPS
jgi:glycine betaine/proline transport system substrate-binding protein